MVIRWSSWWVLAAGLALLARANPAAAQPAPTPEPGSNTPLEAPGNTSASTLSTGGSPASPEDWAIHGQSTFVDQYHPGFASAYRGPNSLDPGSRGDETWDVTAYGGFRPWQGAEIWVNPEVDQGFGLSNTTGLASFSSAEAYKVGAATPYVRVPRLFLRQTIDLGGQTQSIDPDLNVLGGTQTSNHVVLTIGKFSVVDVFDNNKYAHDSRNDFLNWTVVDAGAFDYAADAWGFTYGASAEWYQNWWVLRAGLFDGSRTPNSSALDTTFGAQFQTVLEAEADYSLFGQAGKAKLLGYWTRARLATFSELLSYFAANPDGNLVDAESIRHLRNKFGGSLNFEQPITNDVGAFLRASLSDGRTETYDFTDVDRSLSLGVSVVGNRWGRPSDTVGATFVVNNLSKAHKDYFADGGIGVLIGDGRLTNAGPEQIFEAYYSAGIYKGVEVTGDYQLVNHPAYNVDRGPVDIFAIRLHGQF